MLDIHQFDESVLGKETSDPLHFAFADKTSRLGTSGDQGSTVLLSTRLNEPSSCRFNRLEREHLWIQ